MNLGSPILRELQKSYHEYPSEEQRQMFLDYSRSMQARLAVAVELNKLEDQVGQATTDAIMAQRPKMQSERPALAEKCRDDFAISTRFCLQAMLLDCPDYLDAKVLNCFAGVLDEVHFDSKTREFVYAQFRSEWKTVLSEDHFSWIEPYLDRFVTVLANTEATEITNA